MCVCMRACVNACVRACMHAYVKLVCLLVGHDSMPKGFFKTESNLVWIFRGFGMKLFITHSFKN